MRSPEGGGGALSKAAWAIRTGAAYDLLYSVEKCVAEGPLRFSRIAGSAHGMVSAASVVTARLVEAACDHLVSSRGGSIVPSARTRDPGTQLCIGAPGTGLLGMSLRIGLDAGVNFKLTDREPPVIA